MNYFALKPSPEGIGIYTTLLFINNNRLRPSLAPSPAGEGWGEENKINLLSLFFFLYGEKENTCVDSYAPDGDGSGEEKIKYMKFIVF